MIVLRVEDRLTSMPTIGLMQLAACKWPPSRRGGGFPFKGRDNISLSACTSAPASSDTAIEIPMVVAHKCALHAFSTGSMSSTPSGMLVGVLALIDLGFWTVNGMRCWVACFIQKCAESLMIDSMQIQYVCLIAASCVIC